MTVVCCSCKVELSEKCAKCGRVITATWAEGSGAFVCNCGHTFDKGSGGISHGYCSPCLEVFKAS